MGCTGVQLRVAPPSTKKTTSLEISSKRQPWCSGSPLSLSFQSTCTLMAVSSKMPLKEPRSPNTRWLETPSDTSPETPLFRQKPVWRPNYNLLPCQSILPLLKSRNVVLHRETRDLSLLTLSWTELSSETEPEEARSQVLPWVLGKGLISCT